MIKKNICLCLVLSVAMQFHSPRKSTPAREGLKETEAGPRDLGGQVHTKRSTNPPPLSCATTAMLGWLTTGKGSPVHCGMFSTIPGLYPPGISSSFPQLSPKSPSPNHLPNLPHPQPGCDNQNNLLLLLLLFSHEIKSTP